MKRFGSINADFARISTAIMVLATSVLFAFLGGCGDESGSGAEKESTNQSPGDQSNSDRTKDTSKTSSGAEGDQSDSEKIPDGKNVGEMPPSEEPELRPATFESVQSYLREGARRKSFREFVDANEQFRQALAILPEEPKTAPVIQVKAMIHFLLGQVLSESSPDQDHAAASENFRNARALGMNTLEVSLYLAASLYRQDLFDESLKEYLSIKAILPKEPPSTGLIEVLSGEARVYIRQGEVEKAKAAFEELASKYERFCSSLPIFESGERMSPPVDLDIRVSTLEAEVAASEEDWAKEAAAFQKILRLDPESKDVHYRLYRNLLTRQNKSEEAAVEKEIHELLTNATENISSKAQADVDNLRKIFLRLKVLMPNYYKSYARIARACRVAEMNFEAIAEADRGLEEIPDEAYGADFLRAELHKLKGDAHAEMGRVATRRAFKIESLEKAKASYATSAELAPAFSEKVAEIVAQINQTIRNLEAEG